MFKEVMIVAVLASASIVHAQAGDEGPFGTPGPDAGGRGLHVKNPPKWHFSGQGSSYEVDPSTVHGVLGWLFGNAPIASQHSMTVDEAVAKFVADRNAQLAK